jgi:hypothetical protein
MDMIIDIQIILDIRIIVNVLIVTNIIIHINIIIDILITNGILVWDRGLRPRFIDHFTKVQTFPGRIWCIFYLNPILTTLITQQSLWFDMAGYQWKLSTFRWRSLRIIGRSMDNHSSICTNLIDMRMINHFHQAKVGTNISTKWVLDCPRMRKFHDQIRPGKVWTFVKWSIDRDLDRGLKPIYQYWYW